jgi:hypothetical protein
MAVRLLRWSKGLRLGASEGPGRRTIWKLFAISTSARFDTGIRATGGGRPLDRTNLAMAPSGGVLDTAKAKESDFG